MVTGYQPIVWNETLNTGVKAIDEQHQILVNMLNEASYRLTENSGRDVLEEIVHDLLSYALYHFDTEEALMFEKHYDQQARDAHVQEHRAFSQKIAHLQQDLRQSKLISREDLLSLLNDWLVDHIMKTDMQLGAYLNSLVTNK